MPETIKCDLCGVDTEEPHMIDISAIDSESDHDHIIETLYFCPSCLSSILRSLLPKLSPSERLAALSGYVSKIKHVKSKQKDIDKKVKGIRNEVLEALARLEQLEIDG